MAETASLKTFRYRLDASSLSGVVVEGRLACRLGCEMSDGP